MIERSASVLRGAPRVANTRLSVYDVVLKRWTEQNLDVLLEDYCLTTQQVEEAVRYCTQLRCVRTEDEGAYCSGCVLNELGEPLGARDSIKRKFVETTDTECLRNLVSDDLLDFDQTHRRGWEVAERPAGEGWDRFLRPTL